MLSIEQLELAETEPIEGLTVQEISTRLMLNMRWCQRLQARALEAFSKSIQKEVSAC